MRGRFPLSPRRRPRALPRRPLSDPNTETAKNGAGAPISAAMTSMIPRARLLLPGLRRARVRRRLRLIQATWCPCRVIRRQLTAELDPSPLLVQEAGAVVSQVVGDEFAWRLGLTHRRRSRRITRSKIHPPPRCGNCGKTPVENRRRTLGLRACGPATLRPSTRSEVTRTGDVRKKSRKERELLSTSLLCQRCTPVLPRSFRRRR